MMEGANCHALKISDSGPDLLLRLSREGHEGDPPRPRDSGPHGVAGLLHHGVRVASSGNDDSAVLLDQDRLTLLRI